MAVGKAQAFHLHFGMGEQPCRIEDIPCSGTIQEGDELSRCEVMQIENRNVLRLEGTEELGIHDSDGFQRNPVQEI